MECNDARRLLAAQADGELDLVHQLDIEQHLRACPACAALAENLRTRRAALRESLPRFAASPQLASKIRDALRAEAAATVAAPAGDRPAERAKILLFPVWRFGALAASLAIALFVGFEWGTSHSHRGRLVDEAVSDHIRSLEANHLNDVASTDQHTVKPWFAGHLTFSPPVVDLATEGFPLTGGRLEQIDHRTAAALVYHRRKHAINVFVWPVTDTTAVTTGRAARDGFNVETWTQAGLNFVAVSEIPATELAEFVELFRKRTQ